MVSSVAEAVDTLAMQVGQTVQWRQCLTQARERGASVFLELGPGNAMTKIAQELFPECEVRSIDEFKSLTGALAWLERRTAAI